MNLIECYTRNVSNCLDVWVGRLELYTLIRFDGKSWGVHVHKYTCGYCLESVCLIEGEGKNEEEEEKHVASANT